ncbi:MAG: hypothetical protein ACKV1O_12280 [Saprospiraceae bacterium]
MTTTNKIKKGIMVHRTPTNPPQKPTHKAQRGGNTGVLSVQG